MKIIKDRELRDLGSDPNTLGCREWATQQVTSGTKYSPYNLQEKNRAETNSPKYVERSALFFSP